MTAGMTNGEAVSDWTCRIIVGSSVGVDAPPAWLRAAYEVFRTNVMDEMYPCYFGSQAENKGALYYSFLSGGDMAHLPQTLCTFLSACPKIKRDRNNLVLFFEPDAYSATQAQHRAEFWTTLRYLQDNDPCPASPSHLLDSSDPSWEFRFANREFFVVGASPSYRQHRSRNLGPCMLMIFQPREVFGSEANVTTRRLIRHRAQMWDGIAAHPDLNTFGQLGNREWAQYFISDDNSPARGRCPLFHDVERNANNRESDPTPPVVGAADDC